MLISYDASRVFYTVARLGSFTKAAGALLSSQPNLTRTIRNLESALGCTLFVRSNRGAVLTPEGEKLFARVAVACEQIQAGEEELASDRSLQSGVVLGAAALLDGMADRMEEELNGEATLVVTGGLAPVVLPYCRRKAIRAPDLVLEGLYRYWQLNR